MRAPDPDRPHEIMALPRTVEFDPIGAREIKMLVAGIGASMPEVDRVSPGRRRHQLVVVARTCASLQQAPRRVAEHPRADAAFARPHVRGSESWPRATAWPSVLTAFLFDVARQPLLTLGSRRSGGPQRENVPKQKICPREEP
jgi:hypothetical protein